MNAHVQNRESTAAASGRHRTEPRIRQLRIRNLTRQFGELTALRNFDLDVEGGEFISLLGPSGCGKTTALNCIAGLLVPDGGEIELDGQSMIRTPPERRNFGMVFQNYALFPQLSVWKNVSFGLEMQRIAKPEIRERVERVLNLVRLLEHRDKYPAQLSGGQQQRIAIARAIVTEPQLMLMDEPLSNLDAKLRQEMRTEIRRIHQDLGLTTIYVTHDQEEALSLSDRVVLMEHGVIRQVGTPREVYLEPTSAYAANFLGSRNLLPVRVITPNDAMIEIETETGLKLTGTPRGTFAAGHQATMAIRPEDITAHPRQEDGPNTIHGVVQTVEFLGQGTGISVQTQLAHELIVRTEGIWNQGDPVTLELPRERLFIFPPEGAEG